MTNSDITKIIFNGRLTEAESFEEVVRALSNETILAEKGGYIFSVHIDEDTIHMGMLPCFIGSERTHHYDIDIPESPFNLIGFVNLDTSIELFFKLSRDDYEKGLNDAGKVRYREMYVRFARFMLEMSLPHRTELKCATRDLLREFDVIPEPPETIGALAAVPVA